MKKCFNQVGRHVLLYCAMSLASILSAAPRYINTDRVAVNYNQAEAVCQSLNATLPAPQTWTQHEQLIRKMMVNSPTTAWLRFKKTKRTTYTWANNEEVQEGRINQMQLSVNRRECGQLRLQEQDLKDANCAFTGYGYICRHQGTCPESFYFYNCHYLATEDVSFTFQCGVSNWFSARSQCEANGGELARFDSSVQVTEVLTKMKQFQGCTSFWVGFSRVNWEYHDNTSDTTTTIKLAPWHLWEPELNRGCSVVTLMSGRYAWQAVQCSAAAAYPVICQINETSPSKIPDGSTVMPPEVTSSNCTKKKCVPGDKNKGGCNTACAIVIILLVSSALFIVMTSMRGAKAQEVLRSCFKRILPCVKWENDNSSQRGLPNTEAGYSKAEKQHGENSKGGPQPEIVPLQEEALKSV